MCEEEKENHQWLLWTDNKLIFYVSFQSFFLSLYAFLAKKKPYARFLVSLVYFFTKHYIMSILI